MSVGLTEDADGVQRGITGQLIVEKHEPDNSDEPRDSLTALSPGDTILFRGEEATVQSVGHRVNFGQRGMYSLGFGAEVLGTVATLYVDRDPYLLDICNGPVHEVDPEAVQVPEAVQTTDTYGDY